MNEFGRNIQGLKGIYKRKQFWNSKATAAERTFTLESGPGCDPKDPGRKIAVSWDSDGGRETISSYDLEAIIDAKGNVVPRNDNTVDDTPALFLSNGAKNVEAPAAKPKGRNAWAPMPTEPSELAKKNEPNFMAADGVMHVVDNGNPEPAKLERPSPAAVVAAVVEGVVKQAAVRVVIAEGDSIQGHVHTPAVPPQHKPVNGTLVVANDLHINDVGEIPGKRKAKGYDVTLAVAMYAEGKTIAEIAAAQGFTPGNGLNKTRVALREAGVWKGK